MTSKIVGGIFNHRDTYNRIRGVKEYALPIMRTSFITYKHSLGGMGNSVSSAFHNSSAFYNKCLGVFYFSVILL